MTASRQPTRGGTTSLLYSVGNHCWCVWCMLAQYRRMWCGDGPGLVTARSGLESASGSSPHTLPLYPGNGQPNTRHLPMPNTAAISTSLSTSHNAFAKSPLTRAVDTSAGSHATPPGHLLNTECVERRPHDISIKLKKGPGVT